MSDPGTTREPFNKDRARRLLGMYVFGVAVGCVLVGVLLNMKRHFRPPPPVPATSAPAPGPAPTPPGEKGEPVAPDAVGTPEPAQGGVGG